MTLKESQNFAFHIILGDEYFSYNKALKVLKQDRLEIRRKKQSLKFARHFSKDPRQKDKFLPRTSNTREENKKFHEPKFRTTSYEKSPIPFFIKLLNEPFMNVSCKMWTITVHFIYSKQCDFLKLLTKLYFKMYTLKYFFLLFDK